MKEARFWPPSAVAGMRVIGWRTAFSRTARLQSRSATMVLDTATALADLAGVLVLVNIGRGGPAPCLFNPLHGPSARQVTWRLLGSREQLRVPACGACAQAISRHRPPEVLPDTVHKKHVPYLDVDPGMSVWAATGFGVFSDDLVGRVLRGDFHHRRTGAG